MLRPTIATRAVLFSAAVIANLVALEAVTFNFGSRPAGDESDLLKLNFHYRPGEALRPPDASRAREGAEHKATTASLALLLSRVAARRRTMANFSGLVMPSVMQSALH